MVTVRVFDKDSALHVIENGFDRICVVRSRYNYLYVARYQRLHSDDDYCHYYQISFDKGVVTYHLGQYPRYRHCANVTREALFSYLETNFPEDMDWLLFHPELYSGRFDPDV